MHVLTSRDCEDSKIVEIAESLYLHCYVTLPKKEGVSVTLSVTQAEVAIQGNKIALYGKSNRHDFTILHILRFCRFCDLAYFAISNFLHFKLPYATYQS